MPYTDWRNAYLQVAEKDERAQARLWNLDHEDRIPNDLKRFQDQIGAAFDGQTAAGVSSEEAATQALSQAIEATVPVGSQWLGLLPGGNGGNLGITQLETHAHSMDIPRYRTLAYFDQADPPNEVTLQTPFKMKIESGRSVPARRFVWVTFAHEGRQVSRDDPTALVRELGLQHFVPLPGSTASGFVYRFEMLLASNQPAWIPTALDAGLYEAWAPTPEGHAHRWGLTRDLTDGSPKWPELLVETKAYHDHRWVGKLVPPRSPDPTPIGPVTVKPMAGR